MTAGTKPLSATMVACLDDATEAGGELVRYQGGFWAPRNAPRNGNGIPQPWHGSTTVQALVTRERADYSEWKDGRGGRFPVAMKVRADG